VMLLLNMIEHLMHGSFPREILPTLITQTFTTGSGSVHGYYPNLSSARGELQGITALTIIFKLLRDYHLTSATAIIVCNNKGVLNSCANGTFCSLRNHREANIDLYSTQHTIQKSIEINHQWVKGHTETKPWDTVAGLQSQSLHRDSIYNVWCDRVANETWLKGNPSLPEVTILEKWVVYSKFPSFHKITGNLTEGVFSTIGYPTLLKYIQHKHGMREGKLDRVNLLALQAYFTRL
jgi:hypothetical protein